MHPICALLGLLSIIPTVTATICPPFLPTLPVNYHLANIPPIKNFTSSLHSILTSLTQDATYLGNSNTSFSLDVYSLADSSPLFTYHFSGQNLANASYGVSHVDSSTTYMIGSITKVLTIYTYLTNIGLKHWNDPITNFIPELSSYAKTHPPNPHNNLNIVDWSSITIAQLASHLSGVPRDTLSSAFSDAMYRSVSNLPPVQPAPGTFCNGSALGLFPCHRNDTLSNLLSQHPIHHPNTIPTYSNIAFQLIAWALESITHTPFDHLMNTLIDKLHLQNSFYPIPKAQSQYTHAIIPNSPSTSGFDTNLRSDAPSGAFYSSIDDMRLIGKSVLGSTLMPYATTQTWLKPTSFTSDRLVSVGAPWEITSWPPPGSAEGRFPVEIVSKAGDFGVYSAIIGLIPEYEVGFTVLAAGERAHAVSREGADLIVERLVPALTAAGYEAAKGMLEGVFVDEKTNSSVVLKVVRDKEEIGGRGRAMLEEWVWKGVSLLKVIGGLLNIDPVQAGLQFTLYPTGLKQKFENGTARESWRAAYSTHGNDAVTGSKGNGPFSTMCMSWTEVNGFVYGGVGFDEFVLEMDRDGVVVAVEARVLQRGYWDRESGKLGQMALQGRREGEVRMVREMEMA